MGLGVGSVCEALEVDAGSATSWLHILRERDLPSLCFSFLICNMGTIAKSSG